MSTCKTPYWRRFWAVYAALAVSLEVVGDATAYVGYGWEATLTAAIRRWAGLEPRTSYGRLGQGALLAFFGWMAVHLAFGILGPSRGRPR
jgi:hypothetical protein